MSIDLRAANVQIGSFLLVLEEKQRSGGTMSSVSSSENVFPDNDAEWSNRFLVSDHTRSRSFEKKGNSKEV